MSETSTNTNNNNITISNNVSMPDVVIPSHHGAGTVLLFLFFWPVLLFWWPVLLTGWLVWLLIAGITTIFDRGFFTQTWYYPWPVWLFGIR
jgi:hypothetical protein